MANIEFISYDGEFPNLCRGVLTVKIDGEIHKFGSDSYRFNKRDGNIPNNWHDSFWTSGGCVDFDTNENPLIETRKWKLSPYVDDEFILNLSDLLLDVFNKNVPYGCCGGCL